MVVEEKVKAYIEKIKKEDRGVNAFLHLNEKVVEEAREIDEKVKKTGKKGRLYGHVFGIKSNINVKGMITNCASKVLENYCAPYDATVIEKIRAEDGLIIGMTNCDEFAAGGSGENSAFGATQNPAASGRVAGGSSSGSAAAVAAGFCDVALGSDTGGSLRNPASHCGLVGVKPSYGLVSRYGLIDLSMSLDQIGPIAKNVQDAALVLDVIRGVDERDCTTTTFSSLPIETNNHKKVKLGVMRVKGVEPAIQRLVDARVLAVIEKFAKIDKDNKMSQISLRRSLKTHQKQIMENSDDFIMQNQNSPDREFCTKDDTINRIPCNSNFSIQKTGWSAKDIEIEHIELAVQTYYLLVYAEFFSGTQRFDGRRYGVKIEEACGREVLRRILGGKEITRAEFEGAYYQKALAVKELIRAEFEKAFKNVDALVLPTCPSLPWKVGEGDKMDVEEVYAYDALTIPANLAGICAVSLPMGKIEGIPVGMQVMCGRGEEGKMLGIAQAFE